MRKGLTAARHFGSMIYPEAFSEGASYEEKVRVTKEYMLYLVDEVGEVLRELSWKAHRTESKEFSRRNFLEELIDIHKFWLGAMALWGFKVDEIEEELSRKTEVVLQRYEQEMALAETTRPLAVLDIDGVLADYLTSFEVFVGRPLSSLSGVERARYKHQYRDQGFEGNYVTARVEAPEFTRRLKEWGYFIVALTARPYSRYKRMFGDTLEFMRRNGIHADAIVFDEDKQGFMLRQMDSGKRVALFVDDEDDHLKKAESLGIATHKVGPGDNLLDIVRIPEEVGGS